MGYRAMKVYIFPEFGGVDKGDGGIRRVVEAQRRHLPAYDIEVVGTPEEANILAVHIQGTRAILANYPEKPLVVHSHGLYWAEHQWEDAWYQKANAGCIETIRQADAVTAPSEWVAQAIRRNTLRQVTVAYHGVELEEWPQRKGRGAGYVLWNKTRVDSICDPAPLVELAAAASDVQFVTTFWPENKEVPSNVKVVGKQPYKEHLKLIREASVYLCTARETFGIGTIEAMAAGVPILGWRWGGQLEFVEQKVTGWLSAPGDNQGLVEGLKFCLAHQARLGAAGRALVEERFQWKDAIKVYANLYQQLAAESKAPRPKVSVVIPAYNLAEFLPEAIDSVLAQTMKDFECIIVDDASPDETGEIANTYAERDSRVRVIHNETNQYLAGALNIGIGEAKGKFVVPLDADNLLPPRMLEILSQEMEVRRDLHIAYGSVEFWESDGRRWHSGWPMKFNADWQLMQRNMIPSTCMYRKEAI